MVDKWTPGEPILQRSAGDGWGGGVLPCRLYRARYLALGIDSVVQYAFINRTDRRDGVKGDTGTYQACVPPRVVSLETAGRHRHPN